MNRKVIIIKFNYRGIVGISCFIVLISTAVVLRSRKGIHVLRLDFAAAPTHSISIAASTSSEFHKSHIPDDKREQANKTRRQQQQPINRERKREKCHSQWLIQWRTMEWNCITDWQCASERNDNNEPITWANYLIVVKRINLSKRLANCIENGSAIVLQVIHSASESTCGASILRRIEYQFNLSDNLCQSRAQSP